MAINERTIVQELIELDPSLEAHRLMLEGNIRTLLAARPDTRFSAAFKKQLLADLRERLALDVPSTHFPFFTMMHKILYAGGGALLGAFIAVFVIQSLPGLDGNGLLPVQNDDGNPTMPIAMQEDVGDAVEPTMAPKAFGPLSDEVAANSRPQSGGGGGAGVMGGAMPPVETMMYGDSDAKMIAPYPEYQPVAVDYLYDGEVILPEEDVTVLRRSTPKMTDDGSVLKNTFASSLFNISKVPGLKMQSVSLTQESRTPYFVNIDFQNGTVSINKNIDYAARPESTCTDDACFARYRMKMNDIPSDSAIIAMADAFMKEFSVDMSSLGAPVMQDDWRYWYETSTDKASYWFPEQLSVIYPYSINGKSVYDEWGNALGVNVTVDVRENAVTGVWGLQTMQFQSSTYAAAKNADAVKKIIREGGRNMWRDPNSKIFESTLNDPSDVYVQIYMWDQKSLIGETLFVPALAFPVESIPMEANMVKKFVIVPLAEELLQSDDQSGYPTPRMMPLQDGVMEGAAG